MDWNQESMINTFFRHVSYQLSLICEDENCGRETVRDFRHVWALNFPIDNKNIEIILMNTITTQNRAYNANISKTLVENKLNRSQIKF